MASVTFEKVTKKFGDVIAVNNVSLEVKDKEFLVMVGPSGCGKSTMLRMAAGLEELTTGNIYIGDRLVNDVRPRDRDVAMVFQSYALYPHMSVYKNLAFTLKARRTSKEDIDYLVKKTSAILGIENLLTRRPKQLSGGQRQRVALGRSIIREPEVFLMDEPLSNLDAKLRLATRAELIKLHKRLQTTVIYVTHDQVEAMTMGTRIALLKDGVLMQLDNPQNLYTYPANMCVAEFIGSPAMNFFDVQLVGQPEEIYLDGGTFRLRVPESKKFVARYLGNKVVLGIRPEHITDRTDRAKINGNTMRVHVDVVEPMGGEALLYLLTGHKNFVARTEYRPEVRAGDDIEVVVNLEHMHLFDFQTHAGLR